MTQTTKKKGMGRGLSALLSDAEVDATSRDGVNIGSVALIPLANLEANPFQPRTEFDPEQLEELRQSISIHGVIQPITVRKMGYDKYQLISGERRTRAAMMAGLTQIPAYIRVANDQEMLEIALIENIQRSDLNAIDVAVSYQRLIEECNISQDELGERVGKDRTTVNNYLRLLRLPDEIQMGIKVGKVSMGQARAIINIPDQQQQLELYQHIIANNLSVRDVEALAKKVKAGGMGDYNPGMGTDWDPEVDRIMEAFHQRLKAAVHLKNGAKGGGKIVISYKSREDLVRILSRIPE